MAILRSFIFRPESNLPRPDSLPVVPHPDDGVLRDDVILKNVSQPTIWGGIFAIAACLIPNNAVWKPVIRLAKGQIWDRPFGGVQAKTYGPRSETPSVSRIHGND
jgi:hypothetical protein